MSTFKTYHLSCPMCDSSDAYAVDHDGIGHCFSCGGTYDENTSKKTNFKKKEPTMQTTDIKAIELGVYKDIPDRYILKDTAIKYNYQVSVDGTKHIANVTNTAQKIRFIESKKFLYINKPKTEKLFGATAFKSDQVKPLIITEGELDAMSVFQTTGLPAVSITHGTKSVYKCVRDNIEYIKGFRGVILALDNDAPGKEASSVAAKLLMQNDIQIVKVLYPFGVKDSNEALMKGLEIELAEAFNEARAELIIEDAADETVKDIYFVSKQDRFYTKNKSDLLVSLNTLRVRERLQAIHPLLDKEQLTSAIRSITDIDGEFFCEDFTNQPYKRFGRVIIDGSPKLNISQYKTVDALPGEAPILMQLFEDMFGEEQLPYFMGWLSYFFKCCHDYDLKPSSALYLAGDQGAGKGLLHDVILKALVGQGADGSMLFTSGFTGKIYEHPFINFSDTFAELNEKERTRFTGILKNVVANGDRVVNHKYGGIENISWKGRVIVSLNLDEKSSEALPDVHNDDLDKFMLLKVKKGKTITEHNYDKWQAIVDREAPHLAHYLLNYEIDEDKRDARFGIKAYHDKHLMDEIRMQNRNTLVAKTLQEIIIQREEESMLCTPEELLLMINDIDNQKPLCLRSMHENIKIRAFSRKMTELANTYEWITRKNHSGKIKYLIERET